MNIYEQILAGLQTKFLGADLATLQRIASKRSEGVTDESKVKGIVDGVTLMDVIQNYGDFRADGAQKSAVANYESKYHIKDGKPINPDDPYPDPHKQDPPQQQQQQVSVGEQIAAALGPALREALKPINDRFAAMDAASEQQTFDAKVAEVAKSFNIPEFAYKGKVIPQDADLNQYFTDLKQEMTDQGFQFAKAPESGEQQVQKDASAIGKMINDGTESIVKSQNK